LIRGVNTIVYRNVTFVVLGLHPLLPLPFVLYRPPHSDFIVSLRMYVGSLSIAFNRAPARRIAEADTHTYTYAETGEKTRGTNTYQLEYRRLPTPETREPPTLIVLVVL
jgi:hypothetical protein